MMPNNIHYLYNSKTGIELIFCDNSTISYPLHNHVSVLTIGIVLGGSIVLTTNNEVKTYEKNQTFVIFPYMPHSISAHSSYTLLSLCIDKNAVTQYATDIIRNNAAALLMNALSTEKINQYQILQLLNCLNLLVDYSDCYSDNQNPFINKYHFIRSFKAEVGLTPHQFQVQNRIRKAQRLMHKAETITEVALTTGFCDQSHFIKQFEKQVGLPPLTYKMSSDTI